jgi:hypothetical protein
MSLSEFTAHWIMASRNGRMILKMLEMAAFFVGMLMMGFIFYMVETRFMPIITGWELQYIQRDGDKYHMGGVLRKERACELVATEVMAVPKMPLMPRQTVYRIKPHDFNGAQVPTGYHMWGPWDVQVPAVFNTNRGDIAFLEVVGIHRCHAFWLQQTLYGRIRMEEMP